jgi:hypothetical protein
MTNLGNLTTSQLLRLIAIKEKIEKLQGQIDSIADGNGELPAPVVGAKLPKKRRRMSAAARAKISAGASARWAKFRAAKGKTAPKKRRKMSAAARAKFAAIARARWKKAKAAGKNKL